mmetsp:Transcript_42367/g.85727  ORF Transcript_42367/g.85727 Transcript_42367/m.85727 type:complete len:383 (+) Transcript_42367:133-1281(+)
MRPSGNQANAVFRKISSVGVANQSDSSSSSSTGTSKSSKQTMEQNPKTGDPIVALAAFGAPADSSSAAASSRIDDGVSASAVTSAWQEVVRKFPEKPLSEDQKAVFLAQGELILLRNIRREDFFDALRGEENGFAKGMEWRVVDPQSDAAVGDIVVTTLPLAPHEIAQRALERAFTSFVDLHAQNPAIANTIVGTGSTRYSGPTRSAEADGGFRPEDSPMNAAGKAVPTLVFEVAYSESIPHVQTKAFWWFQTFPEVEDLILLWVRPERYGTRGHHGVPPGERPVLVWHFTRTRGIAPSQPWLLVIPQGTPACPHCTTYREHLDIGSAWVGAGYGVYTITIPSANLFRTIGRVPNGFPANVVIDLFIVRRALERLQDSEFQW